ncbi:unnamed protein product [Boreogadus saida]
MQQRLKIKLRRRRRRRGGGQFTAWIVFSTTTNTITSTTNCCGKPPFSELSPWSHEEEENYRGGSGSCRCSTAGNTAGVAA